MRFRTFQDVVVWKKAHAPVLGAYRLSRQFPKEELFGLTLQLRRAAISVPANFAEGFKRRGKADKLRFYNVAQGSLEECRYYPLLAQDLGYGETEPLMSVLEEESRMLGGFVVSVRNREPDAGNQEPGYRAGVVRPPLNPDC